MTKKTQATEEEPKKTCFIIMPIADMDGYDDGHFQRVYDHLIKPACVEAGFTPHRADETNSSNVIVVDILKSILESDMAICDLSGRNPNVFYELGIRQAFNKPVALIKDDATDRIFDTNSLRDQEYKKSLRTDLAKKDIQSIAKMIKDTYEARDTELSSLVQLLGIHPAAPPKDIQLSEDSSILLEAIKGIGSRLSKIERTVPTIYFAGESQSIFENQHIPPQSRRTKLLDDGLLGYLDGKKLNADFMVADGHLEPDDAG